MGQVYISDLLELLGEGGLGDRYQSNKNRFRKFLAQSKWQPRDFRLWIDECLEKGSAARPDFYHALQDIIVTIGLHLGMEVEYGLYGRSPGIGFDGKWLASGDRVLLVEVKASPWPLPSVHQLGSYISRYILTYSADPARVYGLFVIGPGDLAPLVDQIKGSEYRSRIKMIEIYDLVDLWQLKLDLEGKKKSGGTSAAAQVHNLLFPFESVNVGALLSLIQEVVRRSAEQAGEETEAPVVEWTRSELVALLDGCTPAQRTLIAALLAGGPEAVPTAGIVEAMRIAAQQCPGLMASDGISSRTFAGALASLHRLCQQREREPFIERVGDKYRVKESYYEWMAAWAARERLGVTLEPAEITLDAEGSAR